MNILMGDGITVAMAGQDTPDGYYKLDWTLAADKVLVF